MNSHPAVTPSESIWIVVPTFNEGTVIRATLESLVHLGYSVVVIDDCSNDTTAQALAGLPIHLLRHFVNLGQGAALQTGISYALQHGAKYLVTFDADGQHQATDIPRLLEPLQHGGVEVALGTRFGALKAVGISPKRSAILRLATWFTRIETGLKLTDTHNGLRALSASAASQIRITQNRMAHASQILHQIARLNLRFVEVPVRIVYTDYTVQKGQRLSNSVNVLWDSFMELFRR